MLTHRQGLGGKIPWWDGTICFDDRSPHHPNTPCISPNLPCPLEVNLCPLSPNHIIHVVTCAFSHNILSCEYFKMSAAGDCKVNTNGSIHQHHTPPSTEDMYDEHVPTGCMGRSLRDTATLPVSLKVKRQPEGAGQGKSSRTTPLRPSGEAQHARFLKPPAA
jgi:hypothetical protein